VGWESPTISISLREVFLTSRESIDEDESFEGVDFF
jgi:hypothetical protein